VDNDKFHWFGPESISNGYDWEINAKVQFNEKDIIGFFTGRFNMKFSNANTLGYIIEENQLPYDQKS
jgi:hypothetical protein